MAYDEDLANRIREVLAQESGVIEQRMFGGLAFLIGGHMTVSASGQGGLLLHCNPEESETLLAKPHASPMLRRGRALRGWVRVAEEGLTTQRSLKTWVQHSVRHARSLPPKG